MTAPGDAPMQVHREASTRVQHIVGACIGCLRSGCKGQQGKAFSGLVMACVTEIICVCNCCLIRYDTSGACAVFFAHHYARTEYIEHIRTNTQKRKHRQTNAHTNSNEPYIFLIHREINCIYMISHNKGYDGDYLK